MNVELQFYIWCIYNNNFDLLIKYNKISNFLMNFKKEKLEFKVNFFWGENIH